MQRFQVLALLGLIIFAIGGIIEYKSIILHCSEYSDNDNAFRKCLADKEHYDVLGNRIMNIGILVIVLSIAWAIYLAIKRSIEEFKKGLRGEV